MSAGREILIAEDNPADVRLMQEALRALNPPVVVRVARDGEEVVKFFSRDGSAGVAPCPGMLFLDYHLPKVDSRDVLAFVRKNDHLRDMAVVVLTTSNANELMREAYGLGADCYLSKPSDLDDFFHTVQAAATYWLNFPFPPRRE